MSQNPPLEYPCYSCKRDGALCKWDGCPRLHNFYNAATLNFLQSTAEESSSLFEERSDESGGRF
jgi:hypothetical protein